MDAARLELHLIRIAQQFAPTLVPPGWQKPGDYARLASTLTGGSLYDFPVQPKRDPSLVGLTRALAEFNVLVLVGTVSAQLQHQASLYLKEWVETHQRLYGVFAARLFHSFTQNAAYYTDQELPRIVAIRGAATPVIVQMANLLVPYITSRQEMHYSSAVEIQGVVDFVIDQLEAYDLPADDKRRIKRDAAVFMKQLINGFVRYVPVIPLPDLLLAGEDAGGSSAMDLLETDLIPSSDHSSRALRVREDEAAGDESVILHPEKSEQVFTRRIDTTASNSTASTPPFVPPFHMPESLPEIEMLTETGMSRRVPPPPNCLPEMPPDSATDDSTELPRGDAAEDDETQVEQPFDRNRVPMFFRRKNGKDEKHGAGYPPPVKRK